MRLMLIAALASFAIASTVDAQSSPEFPAVPCEDPAASLATIRQSTCGCSDVPRGVCPYDTGDACLRDRLVCRDDACGKLLDPGSLAADRCGAVERDRRDLPNVAIVVSDDANWTGFSDVVDARTGETYSLWDQFYRNQACHGGPNPGAACSKRRHCGNGSCRPWTHRCEGGALDGNPCRADRDDCAGAPCERCGDGECSTNVMRTPNLRRLAERGAFFPIAHTSASVCAPSILSMLSGRYPKDLKLVGGPLQTPNLPRLLSDTHCSTSIGKTWVAKWDQSESCFACCCEEAGCCDDVSTCPDSCTADRCCGDPRTGFHFSIQADYTTPFGQIGRRKQTLERAACLLRSINQDGRAFFAWMLGFAPHSPGGAPNALSQCYARAERSRRLVVDGSRDFLASADYYGRISWFDCMLGSFLDFLEMTPDTRFCPHPDGHGPEAHSCGACARSCSEAEPCGGDVACVDGRCDTDLPCLIDTTVVLYVNDNGKGVGRAKQYFAENGYRNPMILSYGGLGSVDRSAVASLPAAIEPGVYGDRLVHTVDLVPTVLDYTDHAVGGPELRSTATCEAFGVCEALPCRGRDCSRQVGRSLRGLVENGETPWRRFLFGHAATSNGHVSGRGAQYVRGPRIVATGIAGTTGPGSCETDQDCVDQGWAGEGLGLDRCVNGACSRACDADRDCRIPALHAQSECVSGFCLTASECKVYHRPQGCQKEIHNLAQDPRERVNLMDRRPTVPDALEACFDRRNGPGMALHREMSCELVRWCLEGCEPGGEIDCRSCCALEHCPGSCVSAECTTCLSAGTCVQTGPGTCVDCRPSS